jgi:hypothetical protein
LDDARDAPCEVVGSIGSHDEVHRRNDPPPSREA